MSLAVFPVPLSVMSLNLKCRGSVIVIDVSIGAVFCISTSCSFLLWSPLTTKINKKQQQSWVFVCLFLFFWMRVSAVGVMVKCLSV